MKLPHPAARPAPRRGARKHPEHDLQMKVAQFLDWALPRDVWYSAIDHANARDALTGAIRVARGAKRGLPDIIMCVKGRLVGFELKSLRGTVSPAQLACHVGIRRAGGEVYVVRDSFEVEAVLREMGVQLNGRHLPIEAPRRRAVA